MQFLQEKFFLSPTDFPSYLWIPQVIGQAFSIQLIPTRCLQGQLCCTTEQDSGIKLMVYCFIPNGKLLKAT